MGYLSRRTFSHRSSTQRASRAALVAERDDEDIQQYVSGWQSHEVAKKSRDRDKLKEQQSNHISNTSTRKDEDEVYPDSQSYLVCSLQGQPLFVGGRFVGSNAQIRSARRQNTPHLPASRQGQQPDSDTLENARETRYGGSGYFRSIKLSSEDARLQPEEDLRLSQERPSQRSKFSQTPQTDEVSRPYNKGQASNMYEDASSKRKFRNGRVSTRSYEEDRFDLDEEEHAKRRQARRAKAERKQRSQKGSGPPTPIILPAFINVSNLATVLKIKVEQFLAKMKDLGFEGITNDHVLDAETAGLIAAEFNFEPIMENAAEEDIRAQPQSKDKSGLSPRPPVVTIMGHVDHGKTTMLDFLRKSSVAASEHGGITQHIGAFSVPMSGGRLVTFLDTPGHEAFLSMRQRGANVTDIVILVVAADDSVKPQTIEAIKHAKAAKVPIIVAINKVDKPEADTDRVKQDLSRHGLEIEDFGGDTQVVCVSGKTGEGMSELEDAVVALADILDVRAETSGQVEGWVLEAATSKKDGRMATILVRQGTLQIGDVIVAGNSWARVRSLRNEAGSSIPFAGPGTPVEIDGWREQPIAGDEVLQAPDEQRAKRVIDYRRADSERNQLAKDVSAVNEARKFETEKRQLLKQAKEAAEAKGEDASRISMENISPSQPSESSSQEVYFIVKADVSGSTEAVTDAVSALGNNDIRAHVLRSGVGAITEFDVDHAAAAAGHIINFNTPLDFNIQRAAESRGVKILDQSIIYRLVDDVKSLLQEKLPPIITQRVTAEADIAQIFQINTSGRRYVAVAGCRVRNGEIKRNSKVRVLRDREIIYTGIFI